MRVDLNEVGKLQELDTLKMLPLTLGYREQFAEGLRLAEEQFKPEPKPERIDEVIILGTGGGSAASGNLLKSYLFDRLSVPLIINQGYTVPKSVDAQTLALVVSHSGNTEEILSAYAQARAQGAHVVALTAGGKLMAEAEAAGQPVIRVPGGLMPRAALGYIFIPILYVLEKLGLVEGCLAEIPELLDLFAALAQEWGPEAPVERNLAKQLAVGLDGLVPILYGSLPYTDSVAWRWKNQFGENSKVLAFWNAIPALHHDEIVGWDAPSAYTRQFAVVFLRDEEDSEKIQKRIAITRDILKARAGYVAEVTSRGRGRLARLFSLVYLGDFVSIYLPLLRGVDPTPVAVIDLFKRKMAE